MASGVLPVQLIEKRMRGGAQSLLVRDAAGNAYVAKCVGNPQGTRTLINEWIVTHLLKHLRVSTPQIQLLRIEPAIPGDHLLEFNLGNRKVPIAPGVHLGSRFPVDPARHAIFDFLPRRLLHKVANLPDLLLAFAFDRWVNQTDSRQAIFIRERSSSSASFRTYLIDHGHSFGGSRWEFSDGALTGLYPDRSIYTSPQAASECQRAVDRISALREDDIFSALQGIPPEWIHDDDLPRMSRLLELLCGRRTKLHDTVERALLQVQQSGVAIPKSAEGRRIATALLLLACLPAASPRVRGGSLTLDRHPDHHPDVQAAPNSAAPAFHLTARSQSGAVLHRYAIRMWRNEAASRSEDGSNQHSPSGDALYHLRIFGRDLKDDLIAEYSFRAQ